MAKVKIHEIAKEMNLTSKEIIDKANELGIDVKSHLSSIEEEQAKVIKEKLRGNSNSGKKTEKAEDVSADKKLIKEKKKEETEKKFISIL